MHFLTLLYGRPFIKWTQNLREKYSKLLYKPSCFDVCEMIENA